MLKDRRYLVSVLIVVAVIAVGAFLYRGPGTEPDFPDFRAAIVNGLSEEFPNPGFVENITSILASNGYEVDYYNSSRVTLQLYKTLPEKRYDLIILRIHGAPMDGNEPGVAFFTTENQEGMYFTEQLVGWVRRAKTLTRGERFYAVTPLFFAEGMKGKFNDTVIVTMSCYGAVDDTLAGIFLWKGAKAYLGWDEKVTAQHMDELTLHLLEEHLGKGRELQEALRKVNDEYGVDPFYNSRLIMYLRK